MIRDVTIVGMRFYPGAFEYLKEASRRRDVFDQHLYLVADVTNKHDCNAVMLHNGKQKLGSVNALQATALRKVFAKWRAEPDSPGDEVIVCRVDRIDYTAEDFKFVGSIVVHGKHRVSERLARKYADKFRPKD